MATGVTAGNVATGTEAGNVATGTEAGNVATGAEAGNVVADASGTVASAVSGNVCAFDEGPEFDVLCVAVAPADVAADH